jgi:aspartate/methionine/tyrosine aminotransferase
MRQLTGHSADNVLPYAPSGGRPELRAKWRDELYRKNPSLAGRNVSLPLVTSGITHGLSLVADLFFGRGDVFLVPDKYWGNCNMIFGVRRGAQSR